ncbi:23S rRNA (uracil(1939)-C(5))-methyltransferase RlmD [Eubacterium pyruvativorans]|uniref:23S rRNA (uracil(1939)-C(5))-methyltransferase RlmD n=2 Tax=Eubacterium pyruvativorans TaxID=155865 RepID=UPI00156A173F|nr:23S rRNA (uracil(1939)-C(5))-methyltransferase RlmD [Eubacterium pyruvativorans]MCI5746727.1 23S rRNA (uracil(1939)-C(5))-methyltransferase RlmD [Eubacterium pyruvativorans]
MEKGQEVRIIIEDVTEDGQGVGRTADGMTVFARPGRSGVMPLPGDRVRVIARKVKKHYAVSEILELEEPSQDRIPEYCPYEGVCGGCPLGRLRYEKQLELKRRHVTDVLTRIGGIPDPQVAPVISMAEETETRMEGVLPSSPLAYRNKAVMAVSGLRNGEPSVGYMRGRSHQVLDAGPVCRIQAPPAGAAAEALKAFMRSDHVTGWDSEKKTGLMRHMVVRTAAGTGEVMVILVIAGKGIPNGGKLVEMIDEAIYQLPPAPNGVTYSLESVFLSTNRGPLSQIYGEKVENLAGSMTITEEIGGVAFEISPLAFYQVNPAGMQKLYDQVFAFAGLSVGDTVLDLYCGVGSIGLWLNRIMDDQIRVLGIESNEDAVRNANRNAVINHIVNARYVCGKAEDILPQLMGMLPEGQPEQDLTKYLGDHYHLGTVEAAVLDPPRAGCDERLLEAVCAAKPEKIVYVSCDPATMARDVKYLTARGYTFREAVPVDMFPQTGRIETVCLLCYNGGNAQPA